MKYRYAGTGFTINVLPGETTAQAQARILREQQQADRPSLQLLKSQIELVRCIEALELDPNADHSALVGVLREIVKVTHRLEPVP